MKETYTFAPSPMVCSKRITLTVDGDVIESVEFLGGCPGNLAGISRLVLIEGNPQKKKNSRLKR